MKFGIVGPVSKDRVIWPDGSTANKFGAVSYSAAVLGKLLEGSADVVMCLSHLASDDVSEVTKTLDHPNINLMGIYDKENTGSVIELRYTNPQDRISRQTGIMTPISLQELSRLSDCDYIILMPLNETDIPLDKLQQFRRNSRALIFLDVHGLISAVDDQGARYKKHWTDSEKWLDAIDILKMNDKEAAWASGRFLAGFQDYLQYALDMVRRGLVACWITFGDQSSLIAWQRQNKIFWATVPVINAGKAVDTIGCGDAASAGFIYAYARLQSPLIAVVMGNMLGTVKATTYETNFPTRPEVHNLLYHHYRDYFHSLLDEYLSQKHLIINEVEEEPEHEDFMHRANGLRYDNGTDDASGGHRQGIATPWS